MNTTESASGASVWRPGRRSFIGLTAAAAVAAVLPGGGVSAASTSSAFAIDSAPGVRVRVGTGRIFPVTVIDADGNELQHFKRVTRSSIHVLDSPHFTVTSIDPPQAA